MHPYRRYSSTLTCYPPFWSDRNLIGPRFHHPMSSLSPSQTRYTDNAIEIETLTFPCKTKKMRSIIYGVFWRWYLLALLPFVWALWGGLSSQQYKLLIHTLKLSPCEMKLGAEHFHELQIIVFVLMCRVLWRDYFNLSSMIIGLGLPLRRNEPLMNLCLPDHFVKWNRFLFDLKKKAGCLMEFTKCTCFISNKMHTEHMSFL